MFLSRLGPTLTFLALSSLPALQGQEMTPLTVFSPADRAQLRKVETSDAKIAAKTSGGVTVASVTTGHKQKWPGITIKPVSGPWDLSPYGRLTIRVRNPMEKPLSLSCRVDTKPAHGSDPVTQISQNLAPGTESTMTVPLIRTSDDTLGGKLFAMRGYPAKTGGKGSMNPAETTQILLFVTEPEVDQNFELLSIIAEDRYVPPSSWGSDADPFFPFIDTFGQYKHKDWPGKIKSEDELLANHQRELEAIAKDPGPKNWSRYGGWADGPKQKATGAFYTTKIKGKWWLVDPEGFLFFSNGIDCVGTNDFTIIEERRDWFEDFPGDNPRFSELVSKSTAHMFHFAGRKLDSFNFAKANIFRKYGADWQQSHPQFTHKRLRHWGINTVGNWSSSEVVKLRQTPYVASFSIDHLPRIEGSTGYWGKFPDTFLPDFEKKVEDSFRWLAERSANDPWCIGYFSDNEMAWNDATNLSLGVLASPAEQPAKRAFLEMLKKKYHDIKKLNFAWSTRYDSWEDMATSTKAPRKTKAKEDFENFYRALCDSYFSAVQKAIHKLAPQRLYLGCRFAGYNEIAEKSASRFCDVVSYNLYYRNLDNFQYRGEVDKPCLIGEFHFGALDRGLFHTGLVAVTDQARRAASYQEYLLSCYRHPQFVGCHWFQWQDEPVTGRPHDEENYQIGFVDVADTPYPEMIEVSRKFADYMYSRAGANSIRR